MKVLKASTRPYSSTLRRTAGSCSSFRSFASRAKSRAPSIISKVSILNLLTRFSLMGSAMPWKNFFETSVVSSPTVMGFSPAIWAIGRMSFASSWNPASPPASKSRLASSFSSTEAYFVTSDSWNLRTALRCWSASDWARACSRAFLSSG